MITTEHGLRLYDNKNHVTRMLLRGLNILHYILTLKVLVGTIDWDILNRVIIAQWEGMGDVGSPRYEPVLLPPCPTIKVLSYSNC